MLRSEAPWAIQDYLKAGMSLREATQKLAAECGTSEAEMQSILHKAAVQTFYYNYDKFERLRDGGTMDIDAAQAGLDEGLSSSSVGLMLVQLYGVDWMKAALIENEARKRRR
jgi:hypothetical protein